MQRGLNYYSLLDSYHGDLPKPTEECPRVFISHQKNDSVVASKIASYLIDAGIDVYFDQFDASIVRSNPESVVNAISRGIRHSSHMIVLFSSNTSHSMWVPWEIGYAYNSSVILHVLRLKGVGKDTLPEYLQVVDKIMNLQDLNTYISNLTKVDMMQLVSEGRIVDSSDALHPLLNFMDSL